MRLHELSFNRQGAEQINEAQRNPDGINRAQEPVWIRLSLPNDKFMRIQIRIENTVVGMLGDRHHKQPAIKIKQRANSIVRQFKHCETPILGGFGKRRTSCNCMLLMLVTIQSTFVWIDIY